MSKNSSHTDRPLELTVAVEEGPYYKTGSPERKSIAEKGTPGKRLVLEGRVLDIHGRPVPHAWLDFWHANGNGEYDNAGYNLRGHQYSDENGRYRLETVRPREYTFRSPHVHAKVRANDNSPVITVQLFFPGEERNRTDPIFEEKTLMNVAEMKDGETATFDFVVEVD
jgi:protocatechuate 3,4-dioxygenase beta subunit